MITLLDTLLKPKIWRAALNSQYLNNIYAHQRNNKWCWAAGIQIIARNKGLYVTQEYLASQVCSVDSWGRPNDCGAFNLDITDQLYICGQDRQYEYCLIPTLYEGQPNLEWIKAQLLAQNPILIAYRHPNASMGHVVVLTGIEFYYSNDILHVSKFIVRDPDPSIENVRHFGRKTYINAKQFYSWIYAFWDVSLQITDTGWSRRAIHPVLY